MTFKCNTAQGAAGNVNDRGHATQGELGNSSHGGTANNNNNMAAMDNNNRNSVAPALASLMQGTGSAGHVFQ